MNDAVPEAKLNYLVKACKKTGNYKKLAVVGFILTKSILNEMGVKLGFRVIKSSEKLFEYMEMINDILEKNLFFKLLDPDLIEKIKLIELKFLERKGNIPKEHVKGLFSMYYDLKKIEVPNLHESASKDLLYMVPEMRAYSMLSGQDPKKSLGLESLLLQKINEKGSKVMREMEKGYNKELLKEAITLKGINDTIKRREKVGKVSLRGSLKDDLDYRRSLPELLGFTLLGLFFLFLMLGVSTMSGAITHPELVMTLSPLTLIFMMSAMALLYLYWNNFKKEGRNN